MHAYNPKDLSIQLIHGSYNMHTITRAMHLSASRVSYTFCLS